MKIAIMQPYLFPYIGYFQLVSSVNKFVLYDDVNYIKNGWINRNKVLVEGKEHIFTIPLKNASSFSKINATTIDVKNYTRWRDKFLKTIHNSYHKSPQYKEVIHLIDDVLGTTENIISEVARKSIVKVAEYLGLRTEIIPSSCIYLNDNLHSQERVIDICIKEKTTTYINAIGGKILYNSAFFAQKNIELKFIETNNKLSYQQFEYPFVPGLSIIDVIMFNSKENVLSLLNQYQLID